MAFVSVVSADNSSTKLDTFIPRVITHSLKRRPAGFYDLSNCASASPRIAGPVYHAIMLKRVRFELWARGPHRGPRLFDSSISLPCERYSPDPTTSDLSKDPDFISFYAFFIVYKRKSIRERIIASRSNATDYYVETTALDIH